MRKRKHLAVLQKSDAKKASVLFISAAGTCLMTRLQLFSHVPTRLPTACLQGEQRLTKRRDTKKMEKREEMLWVACSRLSGSCTCSLGSFFFHFFQPLQNHKVPTVPVVTVLCSVQRHTYGSHRLLPQKTVISDCEAICVASESPEPFKLVGSVLSVTPLEVSKNVQNLLHFRIIRSPFQI